MKGVKLFASKAAQKAVARSVRRSEIEEAAADSAEKRIRNTETAQERAKRIVTEFHHEIGMSIEQAGRLQGAIQHELERYAKSPAVMGRVE